MQTEQKKPCLISDNPNKRDSKYMLHAVLLSDNLPVVLKMQYRYLKILKCLFFVWITNLMRHMLLAKSFRLLLKFSSDRCFLLITVCRKAFCS